jgi:hypothetical protein
MSDLKTAPTEQSVDAFIGAIGDAQRRAECEAILQLMKDVTRAEPKMWGSSIVGLGSYRYQYASGRSNDWFVAGFSPRKANLTLYIQGGFDRHDELMGRLGKYTTSKSCLYIKRLSDIDLDVLRELLRESVAYVTGAQPQE